MLMEKAEKDLESLLCSVFDEKTARALLALRDGARRYKELEKILGLPQPDVSRLMKKLKELGLIVTREVSRGKGRPGKEAKLSRSFREILLEGLKRKRKEIEELKAKLEELEKLFS